MIKLCDVSKIYGNVHAVNQVSLEIPLHARVAILGPSGSGKTTLLRLIAGLEIPDSGKIIMNGRIVSSPEVVTAPAERKIGFVFQSPALWPHMTLQENILFALEEWDEDAAQRRIDELLDRMGILQLKDRYPNQISGGQARRVSLARALANKPGTLLFDEPLSNLDRRLREDLLLLISESVRTTGSRMVYVTHDEHEAETVADTILYFENGMLGTKME